LVSVAPDIPIFSEQSIRPDEIFRELAFYRDIVDETEFVACHDQTAEKHEKSQWAVNSRAWSKISIEDQKTLANSRGTRYKSTALSRMLGNKDICDTDDTIF
jgi:hypothetical protein